MLEIQKRIVRHRLSDQMERLRHFYAYINKVPDLYDAMAVALSIILYSSNYTDKIYDNLPEKFDSPESVEAAKYEMWGIVHGDKKVIDRLSLFNCSRFGLDVKDGDRANVVTEISAYAKTFLLDGIVKKNKQLQVSCEKIFPHRP
jgi:hypothetical protein